jgi:phosphatidate cytidylyltransferase
MRLGLRLGSAAVLLAVLASALWVGGAYLDVLAGLAICVACWELDGLLRRMGAPAVAWVLYPLALWLLLRHRYPATWSALDWGLGVALVVGLLSLLARPRMMLDRGFVRWAVSVGGAVYLGLSIGYLLLLANHVGEFLGGIQGDLLIGGHLTVVVFGPLGATPHPHLWFWLVAITLGSAMVGDTLALFAGTAIGRTPFFRSISPRKSLEGALAAVAGSVLAWMAAAPPLTGLAWYHALALGVLSSLAAQGGDLVESALKRAAQVKDSSDLIPGHGGLLDRLDSLVLLGPVVYGYLVVAGQV